MTRSTDDPGGEDAAPRLSEAGEARRLAREARLARALRDNLRRRKSDLAGRDAVDGGPVVDEPAEER